MSGGTGSYTSFVWGVSTPGLPTYYYSTGSITFTGRCIHTKNYTVSLTVTDSAGATASGSYVFRCSFPY